MDNGLMHAVMLTLNKRRYAMQAVQIECPAMDLIQYSPLIVHVTAARNAGRPCA